MIIEGDRKPVTAGPASFIGAVQVTVGAGVYGNGGEGGCGGGCGAVLKTRV